MSTSRVAAGVAALALSGLGVLGLQAPAYANHRCPNPGGNYPQGQCDTEGHGDNAGGNGKGSEVKENKDGSVPVHCKGSGYKPLSQGACYAKSTPILLGSLPADALGNIDGYLNAPAGALPPGSHSMILVGVDALGRSHTTVTSFTVVKAATGATGTGKNNSTGIVVVQLPRTGAEIATVSVVGLALIGAGGVAVAGGRRRRTTV